MAKSRQSAGGAGGAPAGASAGKSAGRSTGKPAGKPAGKSNVPSADSAERERERRARQAPRAKQKPAPDEQQRRPGRESAMQPAPRSSMEAYAAADKLRDRVVLVTGGDSGIGRAVAIACAKEGADVAVLYLDEHDDAEETRARVEEAGRRCLTLAGDIGDPEFCRAAIDRVLEELGRLDVLVNNAAEQHPQESLADITPEQLERTFRTNVFGMFYLTSAALEHLQPGSSIINTTSVTAYRGSQELVDYAATKGAIVAFTRSLSKQLAEKGIRVNAVAPGPIWTPLIPSTFDGEKLENFGENVPLGRAGEPDEVAPAYVFLASRDASYMTGQVLHPNGGEVVNA